MKPTPTQEAALRSVRAQLLAVNGELEKMVALTGKFRAEILAEQRRADELRAATVTNLADDQILKLVLTERRINFMVEFVSKNEPLISERQLAALEQIRQFEIRFAEIFPRVNCNSKNWNSPGWPPCDRAKFAVAAINELLQ